MSVRRFLNRLFKYSSVLGIDTIPNRVLELIFMKYGIHQFMKDFPTDDVCLEYIFRKNFPKLKRYKRMKGSKKYQNNKGHKISPLAGTIFRKTKTPLTKWFYAMYLFSVSKHGVSAAELERTLDINHKCAWLMAKRIRSLMNQGKGKLSGIVEADETYIGQRRRLGAWKRKKTPILGAVERGGRVRAVIAKDRSEYSVSPFISKNVRKGSTLMTDEAAVYGTLLGYKHKTVNHSEFQYVNGDKYTNTIEGVWSLMKNGMRGTYHSVSTKHLQSYVDQYVFYYNYRKKNVFEELVKRI